MQIKHLVCAIVFSKTWHLTELYYSPVNFFFKEPIACIIAYECRKEVQIQKYCLNDIAFFAIDEVCIRCKRISNSK